MPEQDPIGTIRIIPRSQSIPQGWEHWNDVSEFHTGIPHIQMRFIIRKS